MAWETVQTIGDKLKNDIVVWFYYKRKTNILTQNECWSI
jgi:hypothetical protein